MKKQRNRMALIACVVAILFVILSSLVVHSSSKYIEKQLLLANQNDAVDTATIIKSNFSISDEEVEYMKSLTFNEMEKDPINLRLMNMVANTSLQNQISNIYVMCLLPDDEVKYTVDATTTEETGFPVGTRLNGIWLLNGKFDENQTYLPSERDDIIRYLEFCKTDQKIFESRESFGLVSEDRWGKFITGYVPLYSTEGTYIGILGVDMSMNIYNDNVAKITSTLFIGFICTVIALMMIFVILFIRYLKIKEGVLYYDFYSRLSHDLRTPMNGILGIADLSKSEDDPKVLHEDIAKMKSSGTYLLALINDTLDFQKLHSNKLVLHKEIVDTKQEVKEVIHMIDETAKDKQVQFETNLLSADVDSYILVDDIRLKQIFVNLLSNAIKFTPAGGTVKWLIELLSRDGNISHCKFTIRDTGIGMSQKFLKHEIFKPFAQEYNSTTTKYSGSGLGLSIVKSLVEQMGGHIEVESEQGEGTTFYVYLDFERVEKEEAEKALHVHLQKEEQTQTILKGTKILLVEDHPLNAEIAQKLLEKQGCIVTWAKNGQECLDDMQQFTPGKYDIILMDLRMPIMDGLTATTEIRALKDPIANSIPIIAMTANAYDDDIEKCLAVGMNAHIAKPINPKNLYETIANHLPRKQA